MKALVVGYGSIGARHARILDDMGHEVRCLTGNNECPFPVEENLSDVVTQWGPDIVLVANATASHFETLADLRRFGFAGRVLIEKPVVAFSSALSQPSFEGAGEVCVGYNLRFHPVVERLKAVLEGVPLYTARLHVGQYLPDWRPGSDYSKGYSASREQGGGVLRDLSHEFDLALWLLGDWQTVTAVGGKVSSLAIDSDDAFAVLMTTNRCPVVSIHVDYLNKPARRGIEINGEGVSMYADLINNRLDINGAVEEYSVERDTTYEKQLELFTAGQTGAMCSLSEGVEVVKLIEAIELSAVEKRWMEAR